MSSPLDRFGDRSRPGMTLGEVAAALNASDWPGDAEIDVVGTLGGKIPVRWEPDDTVAVLRPNREGAVYLRVEGAIERDALTAALHGWGTAVEAKVLEIGFAPPLRR